MGREIVVDQVNFGMNVELVASFKYVRKCVSRDEVSHDDEKLRVGNEAMKKLLNV